MTAAFAPLRPLPLDDTPKDAVLRLAPLGAAGRAHRLTREEILARLRGEPGMLSSRYPIRRLALVGSRERGEAGADGDVDVLVEMDGSIGLRFVDLAADIELAVGRRIDLVSRRAIKPSLWARIERELIDA